jgi:hypothetical protein
MSTKPEKEEENIFNPENSDHTEVIETVENFVQRKGRIESKGTLVKEIKPILSDKGITYADDHINRLLAYGGEEHLKKRGKINIYRDHRGGNPAKVFENKNEEK